MRKRYYTKLRKLLMGVRLLRVHAVDNEVFLCNDYVVVRMPDWLYREQFVTPDAVNYACNFPEVMEGERLTMKYGKIVSENGADIRELWEAAHDRERDDLYLARAYADKFRHLGTSVRFCETENARIMLNNKYYEAFEQATRGGLMYGSHRRAPVWFYDCPEIYRSALSGFALPIIYRDEQVVA